MKFKKGDTVAITAGKDKGKTGKIERVFPRESKALITGINMYKRHLKPRGPGKSGGIVDIIKPMPFANFAIICPKCKKQTRIGFRIEKAIKTRVCRKCQEVI